MADTTAERIHQSAVHGFVGRAREVDELASAAVADELPFLVAWVYGPGGIGKSYLVRRVLSGLPPHVRGLYLDGRDVEPTPAGFCQAMAQAMACPGSARTSRRSLRRWADHRRSWSWTPTKCWGCSIPGCAPASCPPCPRPP